MKGPRLNTKRRELAKTSRGARRPPAVVTKTMRAVKGRDTTPELALRRGLWARGLRYRLCRRDLPGAPDIVFVSRRVAVFVDGDFWHGRQWRSRGFSSLEAQMKRVRNSAYWVKKIARNVERDQRVNRDLRALGWITVRVWESEVSVHLSRALAKVVRAVSPRSQSARRKKT